VHSLRRRTSRAPWLSRSHAPDGVRRFVLTAQLRSVLTIFSLSRRLVYHRQMAAHKTSYTQNLSERIDAAYEAYKAGDSGSDERLYQALGIQAGNVIWFRLRLKDDTLEHALAERAMSALGKFRGSSRLSTWFYKLAQNEANRALRKLIEDRKSLVPIDTLGNPSSGADEPPALWEKARRVDRARQAAQRAKLDVARLGRELPREQAEVVKLCVKGHTLNEIAELTGVPIGTVRSRYRLAKLKMTLNTKEKTGGK
jgi:RNA polymerase sigma-70 factor, ECF subfamily